MIFYLVTGGVGFIGSHIMDELVRRSEHVRDSFSTARRETLSAFLAGIELVGSCKGPRRAAAWCREQAAGG